MKEDGGVVKATENVVVEADNDSVSEGCDSQPHSKKKEKKIKTKAVKVPESVDVSAECEEFITKKKKRKKHTKDGEHDKVLDCCTTLEPEELGLAQAEETVLPTERKRHKKKHKQTTEYSETKLNSGGEENGSKRVCLEDPIVNADVVDNETAPMIKKKKKKSKTQDGPSQGTTSGCGEVETSEGTGRKESVDPMEVALQYINGGHQTVEGREGRGGGCEAGDEGVKHRKKSRRNVGVRETVVNMMEMK